MLARLGIRHVAWLVVATALTCALLLTSGAGAAGPATTSAGHASDAASSPTTSSTSAPSGALRYDDPRQLSRGRTRAAAGRLAAKAAPSPPNRIYSARELRRRAAEPGPFHNFPESFNDEIFERGTRTVTPGFFKKPRANLSNDSVQYRLAGEINGRSGTYEIFARPSASGRTEVITHRFFRPGPR